MSCHTLGYGPVPLREVVDELAAAGITRIGVPIDQLTTGGLRRNLDAAANAGVEVATGVVSRAFTLARPEAWPGERDRLLAALDAAAEAGCRVLYTTTGPGYGLTWDAAAARFAEAVEPVVEHARTLPLHFAIENTATMRVDLGFAHVLSDAVELARSCGLAVCADLFVAWTDRDLAAAIADGVPDFAMVQIADFVVGTRTTPDRAVPGDGDVPIAGQLGWLREAGYTGLIEMELLGPRITAEGPAHAGQRALAVVESLL
jgi:sugar phosphate isomerase/epimerase